jgi:hypothetical protein
VTLPLQEISDRLEIQDLLVAYSHAIDTRRWAALDDVFTADAVIDYTEMGGPRGDLAGTKAFLDRALAGFSAFQHLVAPCLLTIDGDTARGRTACHNPMVLRDADGRETVLVAGLWYRDEFVRTRAGWRIRERYEERCFLNVLAPGA